MATPRESLRTEEQYRGGGGGGNGRLEERSPDEIRHELERDRSQLEVTAEALRRKLTTERLADELWSSLKGKLGSGGDEILRSAKQHPIPLALIGAGIAWLFVESTSGRSVSIGDREWEGGGDDGRLRERMRSAGSSVRTAVGSLGERASEMRERGGELRERTAERAHEMRERASEKAGELKAKAGELRERAGEAATVARRRVRRTAREAKETFEETLERNPLALGAAVAAAGVLLGLALPRTRWEDETLAPARERLTDEAERLGDEALESAKEGLHAGEAESRSAPAGAAEVSMPASRGGTASARPAGEGAAGPEAAVSWSPGRTTETP